MLPLAKLGDYVLAGLEFLRNLPVTSFLDPESLGSSFAIHPGACRARINGRFVQLPCPSRTTYQPPTTVLELASPSSGALPTPIRSVVFDTVAITSQSSTGALAALNLLVILWLFTLLALFLTYKPVLTTARIWIANLCRPVLNATTSVVLSAKPTIRLFEKHQRVLWTIVALAAALDVVQTLSFNQGIVILYADILLVIAASPAMVAAGILTAVLLGFITPASEAPPALEVGTADFVAGMRTQRKRFL
jgi:hypothetical protein